MINIGFMSCFEGENFPGFEKFAFQADQTLLEYDLVLWDITYLHFGYHFSTDKTQAVKKLLKDRKRRLLEINALLNNGKNLVVLLPGSDALNLNIDSVLEPEIEEIFRHEKISRNHLDVYSFLPPDIGERLRESAIVARGKKIDFSGDAAFKDVWLTLKGTAWYNSYLTERIGIPFLYIKGTDYPVATWIKYGKGNIFLLPAMEYDDAGDYPVFVEAASKLVAAIDKLTGETIQILWPDDGTDLELSQTQKVHPIAETYIDLSRISELRAISNQQFDLVKLIALCEELNKCYANECYLAVPMLTRAILDHIPPILGYQTFVEITNSYSGKSFKKSMQHLQNSLRNIADAHLHLPIRNKETLPNRTQVNFSNDLDVLLAEVVRVLKVNV